MTYGVRWAWLGRVGFQPVWELQEELRRRVQAGDAGAEAVLLCEHDPVITLGRGANPANVLLAPEALAERGVDLVPTTRGGDVTYHGPGQLVVYPVVRLRRGLLTTLELVAGVLVRVARELGVSAEWRRDPAGVWTERGKLAACGVHVSRGVAIHGFALNVSVDLSPAGPFGLIVPCGLACARVTSLVAEGASAVPELPALAARVGAGVAAALGGAAWQDDALARTLAPAGQGAWS
ncbi:MAG: lipoyl(octanoyl) transferase LipB [Deltaproteobacteria bacterium]|nr:lipoyl(octanoyl) transferase LipB [Deltaproteobacteria bacterium]